jgi:glycine/sarcosine N-methyltransferase
MDPETDHPDQAAEIASFYDALAPAYDSMTSPGKRVARELPLFRNLVAQYAIATAIDAGSGTGFHAFLLAGLGVKVTAVDLSTEMLNRLEQAAAAGKTDITTVQSDLRELSSRLSGTFDALVCMGNTLAHIPDRAALDQTLRGFAARVKSGGVVLIQLLNYAKILARRERIQSVREDQGNTFIRFYDFEEHRIRFNILRLERSGGETVPSLSSVDLHPVLLPELVEALGRAGFVWREAYGDVAMSPFDPSSSPDLILLALRADIPARR